MTDQLQLRSWQQIKQAQALEYAGTPEGDAALVPPEKPLPDLMLASYHEAIGWNACRKAMIAAAQGEK